MVNEMAWNNIVFLLLSTFLLKASGALYEDQIGKFDWVQRYLGVVNIAVFDESSIPARRVLVATAHNVLACLSTKNGDIIWRHVLESPEPGQVDLSSRNGEVTLIAGNILRTWDTVTAAILQEILLDYTPAPGVLSRLLTQTSTEIILVEQLSGSVLITVLDKKKGVVLDHKTVAAPWLQQSTRCIAAENTLVCVDSHLGLILTLSLTMDDSEFSSQPFSSLGADDLQAGAQVYLEKVVGSPSYIVIQVGGWRRLLHIHPTGLHMTRDLTGTKAVAIAEETFFTVTQVGRQVTLEATDLSSGSELAELGVVVELPHQTGSIESMIVHRFERRDGGKTLRAFITCSDHSIHLISSSGVIWSREEALASVLAVEAVDLPVDGASMNYQKQLSPRTGLIGSLLQRIKTQGSQFIQWIGQVFGRLNSFPTSQHAPMRDQFNLRKLLVLATSSGKIFGMDSWNGDIVWSIYTSHLGPLKGIQGDKVLLYVQRTTAHFPHQAQCVVIGKHRVSGEGLLMAFDPVSGTGVGDRGGVISLGYQLASAQLMQQVDEHYLKPLLLVSTDLIPYVFPKNSENILLEHKAAIFFHLARPESNQLTGYSLKFSQLGALALTEVWSVNLEGGIITGIHKKLPSEKVHSPGRVLADRSVLYKYVNPNLAVVTLQGYDHINKNTLTLHLVDTVTGAVIESVSHKRVSGPLHVVHSENWVVYTCFNDKYRRFEVTSLELFEGLMQNNATSFSSFGVRATPPIMERQAFIMPMGIQAATHTTTEKGITTKFILFALQSGSVLQMSKWFLDPRRPVGPGGPREEGLIPYMPELPLPHQEMITYNHTLPNVSAIYTAPTGLESTCLVLVYGLDLFYTRVFPSKMFDVLKDDFDHFLIAAVLLALVTAAIVTRRLAQRKALKQAWK